LKKLDSRMWLVLASSSRAALGSSQMAIYLTSSRLKHRNLQFVHTLARSRKGHQVNFDRRISLGSIASQWKNETPPGSLTELYVYRPENPRVWPDPVLGVFAPKDQRCCLPGNLGVDLELHPPLPAVPQTEEEKARLERETNKDRLDRSDLLTRFTNRERQAQALYSANDYLQNTADAEETACNDILLDFPDIDGMDKIECKLREAPRLLKQDMLTLFPGRPEARNCSVITLAQKTVNDMTGWSAAVEEEREKLVEAFMQAAQEVCGKLRAEGYWADFIDPTCGKPYYGVYTNSTLFETDERYRLLGFQIEDLGCCKVITHHLFGRHVFVGTIFTDAHPNNGTVQDVFEDLNIALQVPASETSAAAHVTTTGGSTAARGGLADALTGLDPLLKFNNS